MSTVKTHDELQFTGNWFIDAGILGFVTLMEEVYGWDLDELQRRIKKEPDVVYYGYFPFAYFYKLSEENNVGLKKDVIEYIENNKSSGKNILETIWWNYIVESFRNRWVEKKLSVMYKADCLDKKGKRLKKHYDDPLYVGLIQKREDLLNDLVKSFQKELTGIFGSRKKLMKNNTQKHNLSIKDVNTLLNILNANDNKYPEEFVETLRELYTKNEDLRSHLNKVWDDVKSKKVKNEIFCRLPVDNSFYKNFLFFNNSRGIVDQYSDFKNLLDGHASYSKYLSTLDKTVDKFLPSDTEFSNAQYVTFRSETISRHVPFLFVYLLSFLDAFNKIGQLGQFFFYAGDLKFTYQVNKKLKLNLRRISNNNEILRVTWRAIIDAILETESVWALENMYLIRYERMSQQDIIGVDYIGISKLQATILLDDTLRDAINANVPIKTSKGKVEKSIWLLEEFIKNKPLLPQVIRNLHLFLAEDQFLSSRRTLVYASIIDGNVREFGKENRLFGDYFFNRYRQLLTEIKDDAKWSFFVTKTIKELFGDLDERKRYANILLRPIRRNDKSQFVNSLLKALFEKKINKEGENMNKENVKQLTNFVFSKILPNDSSWIHYAIILVIGLVAGGDSDGSS